MSGDPNWSDVVFLSGFEGGTVVDESPLGQTVTLGGAIATSSAQARLGTQSLLRTGSSSTDYASVPDNAAFSLGSSPFTIEASVYFNSLPFNSTNRPIVAQYAGGIGWYLSTNSTNLKFVFDSGIDGNSVTYTWSSRATDTWYDIAVDYDGTSYRIYVGGAMVAKLTYAFAFDDSSAVLSVGGRSAFTHDLDAYIDEVRVTVGTARYGSDGGYTPAAFERGAGSGIADEIEEGIGFSEVTLLGQNYGATVSDGVRTSYRLAQVYRQPALASDTIGMSAALGVVRGVVMLERLRVHLAQVPNHKFQLGLSDTTALADLVRPAVPVLLTQGVGMALNQQAQHAIQVIDALDLAPVIAPMFRYGRSVTDRVRIADRLALFLSGSLTDGVGVALSQVTVAGKPVTISEEIAIEPLVNPQLVLSVTAADTIEISAEDALNFLFSDTVSDGIQLAAAYLSPGDGVTTWVMNTRSGAVTEYTNFAFNSFARMGHKYLAASDEGLFELLGDDDDGTDIVSRIKSGFAQWSGSKFTMFKAAYIAVRGGGDYVLKLTTGDGKSYSYAVSARDMRTTKVNIGKGIRTRYFAFELISDGDDYDLDSLEFVPIASDRRI